MNIAVFIDFDNIEIGVKSTLGEHFDVGVILEAIKERGEVVTKIAYADWTRSGEYSRSLTQHAIRLVQRNMTPGGDKNGADINLALDALEMAFTHPHINAYVIVGGDSDFLSLVEKLKQYDKKVFVVGGRAFTSIILQRNCHEFIAYENLRPRRSQSQPKDGRPSAPATGVAPIAQAIPIVRRALKILADREVTPQTGLLKSTLLQLDSTFSERNYGASSFLDFAEKLAQAGAVTLKHAGRSVTVELNDGFDESSLPQSAPSGEPAAAQPVAQSAAPAVAHPVRAAEGAATAATESVEEGV
ncbi:MAG TPA: NYN domain-containing protein, partial [Vicinamibacterales bacterium]|nr:NYN domain-containing protein [Vicinamibacterales bacterium]